MPGRAAARREGRSRRQRRLQSGPEVVLIEILIVLVRSGIIQLPLCLGIAELGARSACELAFALADELLLVSDP